ncbi:SET domain-containing protein 5 [Diaporthe australafricana]|uniref:SET domain-containing protein 5 n=1 Tax=Diaporthe australafricana TaxID=127596 RepID=A0ABR3XGZ7_9PEZI
MTLLGWFALCVAPLAVAHDISSSTPMHQAGLCHSPLSRSFPLLSTPVCSNDTLITKYLSGDSHSPANRAWTRASSCTANGTAEYCIFTSSTFANGRGIAVLTSPDRADFIANLPGFTDPELLAGENQDEDPELSKFKMVHVPGKDMGVVATQPFQRGDHIMTFTAAIIIDYAMFDDLPEPDMHRLQAEAIDYLPSDLRGRFLNLSTHDGASGYVERVDKILRTNAFDVDVEDENTNGLYVVFPEISRFNHDCRPNADYYFDPETLAQHIHATRPIQIGEEISLTYMDPIRTRAKRLEKLQSVWGFKCGCALCRQRPEMAAASDARIRQIKRVRKQLENYEPGSAATPQMAELMVSLYEQERLSGSIYEAYTFAAIEYNGAGDPSTAVRYARLAIEAGLASAGPRDRDVAEMTRLAEDPWSHWSWMLRTSKRMSWGPMRPMVAQSSEEEDDDEDDI